MSVESVDSTKKFGLTKLEAKTLDGDEAVGEKGLSDTELQVSVKVVPKSKQSIFAKLPKSDAVQVKSPQKAN